MTWNKNFVKTHGFYSNIFDTVNIQWNSRKIIHDYAIQYSICDNYLHNSTAVPTINKNPSQWHT
jgi:hypothetical protein